MSKPAGPLPSAPRPVEDASPQEHLLAESQRLAHIGSWTYKVETRLALWSAEMFRIYGLTPAVEAPPADDRAAMIHTDDRAASAASIRTAIETGRPYTIELRIVRPDGSVRTIVSRGEAHRDARGRVVELMGTAQDITEAKRIEEELHETGALYRLLLQNANDTVFVHEISPDAPGRFLEFNEQASRLLGYTMDELAALSTADIDVPEQAPKIPAIIRGLYETGRAIFTTEWRAKDGRRIPVEISTRLLHVHGRPVVLSIGRDITERVRADELLRQSVHNMRRALGGTINVIMAMVERRDPYTAGHQKRVADLARSIGTAMGLDGNRIEGLRVAGSIHDIGKIAVPLEILSKTTRLTELEMQLIREHSRAGHDILKDVEFPWPVARIVLEHHERRDGSGYPRGLTGDAVLLESRILMVADVVEAMASHRPYRPAHGIEPALAEIERGRGLIYDPAVADACLDLFRRQGYRLVD